MFSCRCVFCVLLVLGSMTYSCLQSVMNLAIVAMVNEDVWSKSTRTSNECEEFVVSNSSKNSPQGEFYWDPYTQGIILGANSYGTIFTHFLGGLISAKFGGKWIYGGGILFQSIFSLLTPVSARAGVGYLFLVRLFFGFAEGVVVPSSVALIARWAPRNERGTFIGINIGGYYLGNAFVSILTGYISSQDNLGGWPTVFYLTGGIGCAWFLLWTSLTYSSPENHPRITKEELSHIQQSQETCQQPTKVPWKSILLSCPFWSMLILNFCHLWLATTFISAMPLYLKTVLRVPIEYIGLIVGLVYPANIVGSLLGGVAADWFRKKTFTPITTLRKIFTTAAFLSGSFCFLCIPLVGCNLQAVFFLMFLTKFTFSFNSGGSSVVLVDMAPQYAGVLNGLVSTATGTTGFISPLLTGTLINEDITRQRWFLVFLVACVIALFGLFLFLCVGSAEVQTWAVIKSVNQSEKEVEKSSETDRLFPKASSSSAYLATQLSL